MVLGKLPVPGRPTNLDLLRQEPTVLAVGAGGGCLYIFSLVYHFSFSPWETGRYRLKHCLKGPLSPKQKTNQPIDSCKPVTGAMALGKLSVPGRPTILMTVGQGPNCDCSRCGW